MNIIHNKNITFFDITILVLSFYVLGAMVVEFFLPMSDEMQELLWMIDTSICFVFIIDFINGLIRADDKLHYLKYGIIDLVASIPNIGILRFGRIAKVLRVFRFIKAAKSINHILNQTFKNKGEGVFKSVVLFSILLVIASSILILTFEKGIGEISTAEDAFWWTIYTIFGMDYCDNPPISVLGKVIAILLSVSGMTLLGSFTAYLAETFLHNNK